MKILFCVSVLLPFTFFVLAAILPKQERPPINSELCNNKTRNEDLLKKDHFSYPYSITLNQNCSKDKIDNGILDIRNTTNFMHKNIRE